MIHQPIQALGLLGQNIQYSLSPKIHLSSAEKMDLNITYSLLDLNEHQVKEFLSDFWTAGGLGFNVTTPYKELVASLINSPLPSVNTVYRGEDGWLGASTDGEGFFNSLKHMGVTSSDLQEITFLGAGGAVLSIVQYLNDFIKKESLDPNQNIRINILRRNSSRDDVFKKMHCPAIEFHFCDFEVLKLQKILHKNPRQLLVHATNAPSRGNDLAEFTKALDNHFEGPFYDLGYVHVSALLKYCLQHRIVCLNGLAMLVEQAMLSQRHWFGKSTYPDMHLLS